MASNIGSALERSSQNLLQLAITKIQMDMQREQNAVQNQQNSERLQFAREQFTEEQKANAFSRIATLIPLMKPGEVNPLIVQSMHEVFPDQDPADIVELMSRPETMESVIGPALVAKFKAMSPEQQEMVFNKELFGEATTDAALKMREDVVANQATSLKRILSDPVTAQQYAEQQLNFTRPVAFQIPGTKQTVMIGPDDAARLATQIWQHNETMAFNVAQRGFDVERFNAQELSNITGSLIDMAKSKNIALPYARAKQIVEAVHFMPKDADKLAPEAVQAARDAKLAELRVGFKGSPQLEASLQLYLAGADLAEAQANSFLDGNPGLQNYLQLGSELESVLGKEQAAKILPIISKQLSKQGKDIAHPENRFLPGPRFDVGGVVNEGALDQAAAEADAASYAAGKLTVQQLTQKWGAETARIIIANAKKKE